MPLQAKSIYSSFEYFSCTDQTKTNLGLLTIHNTFIMKFSLPFVSFLLLLSHCAYAQSSLNDLATRLDSTECYRARATYEVLLPNAELPVTYNLDLMSYTTRTDSLSPCDYMVGWQPVLKDSTTALNGFAAYFSGNFFRFQGGKLSEYHVAENSAPFAPRGSSNLGVQFKEQFAALLPQLLSKEIKTIATDSTYKYTFNTDRSGYILKGSREVRGYTTAEFTYRFDKQGMPVAKEVTTNPGQMGEQIITVNYKSAPAGASCFNLTEQKLIELYPDIFEKYRMNSFTLDNLRGEPLPSFAVNTLSRKRFSHVRGEGLDNITVIAVLDNSVDATADVVSDLRKAMDALPYSATLVLAFVNKDIDSITETVESERPGEMVLVSARSLARDCGVVNFPSILFCRPDGTVADIHIGRNNMFRDIVIQKAALAR